MYSYGYIGQLLVVEVLSSMLNLGLGLGFLPGMFYDRFGPQRTSSVGILVSVSSYLLIWSTTRSILFYSRNSWLMAVYFLFGGFGTAFTYLVALNTNVINFEKKWTASVVGILNTCFAISPSVYSALYYNVFADHDMDAAYAGFMLMIAINFAIMNTLCILFLRIYRDPDYEEFSDVIQNGQSNLHSTNNPENDVDRSSYISLDCLRDSAIESVDVGNGVDYVYPETDDTGGLTTRSGTDNNELDVANSPLSLLNIIRNSEFQILAWTFASVGSVGLVYVNNLTTISKSVHLDAYDKALTVLVPVSSGAVGVFVGVFSDALARHIPRVKIVAFPCICAVCYQVLALIFAYNIALLMMATILSGVAFGTVWVVCPAIMKESFFIGNFGRNWGIAIFLHVLLGLGAQVLFGLLYDEQVPAGENFCYGIHCFRPGLAVTLALACMSFVLSVVLIRKKYKH